MSYILRMVIDGRKIAEDIFTQLEKECTRKNFSLGILVGTQNSVTDSYVRIKARAAERLGVTLVRAEILESVDTGEAVSALQNLQKDVDGVIVQLPVPSQIDLDAVLKAIDPGKDVDGISPAPRVLPPVAGAIEEILRHTDTGVAGKKVVVVGLGRLVGKPAAKLLEAQGAQVTTLVHGDSLDALKDADIVILGAGEPGLVHPEHIKEGVVLIDAGTSELGGKVRGDADSACAQKAAVFTPVPGGVGPIAIAMIFKNLLTLAKK